jgi:translation initiation factor IF-2
MSNRPPVIVILGHVDHGKTTLLDFLRHTSVAAREAGGITQSIRSFQLETPNYGLMTFIDTPGHEAFGNMRERGSRVADIAILIVAADDGVKPQTKQSIEFIKKSGIPFIVAINKSDISGADPDRVKTQLTENDVVVEDFGGNVPSVVISAKTGKNIPELVEMIGLMASLNPPQADPAGKLETIVLESRLDSRKGPLNTVVVKNGTLSVGTELFQEKSLGKVKSLLDSDNHILKEALPSQPVEILGLSQIATVGTLISDSLVKAAPLVSPATSSAQSAGLPNMIVKADVAGSLEAVLSGLSGKVNILSSGTGDIIENDVLLAHTLNARIIAFNLRIPGSIAKLAETEKVEIKSFPIIYELFTFVDDLTRPQKVETIVGKAGILADFKINGDRIAGCRCNEGYLEKSLPVKIMRGPAVVGETRIKSLQQGKSAVDRVKSGIEFGAVFSPYVDFKVGDAIIATIG